MNRPYLTFESKAQLSLYPQIGFLGSAIILLLLQQVIYSCYLVFADLGFLLLIIVIFKEYGNGYDDTLECMQGLTSEKEIEDHAIYQDNKNKELYKKIEKEQNKI